MEANVAKSASKKTTNDAHSDLTGVARSGNIEDVDRAAEETPPEVGTQGFSATEFTHQAIARDGLNLRSVPDTKFPVIGSLPLGTEPNILSLDGGWALADQQGTVPQTVMY